jgi:hypothetical protein
VCERAERSPSDYDIEPEKKTVEQVVRVFSLNGWYTPLSCVRLSPSFFSRKKERQRVRERREPSESV